MIYKIITLKCHLVKLCYKTVRFDIAKLILKQLDFVTMNIQTCNANNIFCELEIRDTKSAHENKPHHL